MKSAIWHGVSACPSQLVSCSVTCQVGPDEVRSNALAEALAQLARRAAFNQLRTVEQLGYIVFLSAWSVELVRSLVRAQRPSALGYSSHVFPGLQIKSATLRVGCGQLAWGAFPMLGAASRGAPSMHSQHAPTNHNTSQAQQTHTLIKLIWPCMVATRLVAGSRIR